MYKILRPLATFLMKIIYSPKIIGRENINKEGALIFVGNHTNFLDPVLLMSSTNRNVHFLGKHTLFKGIGKYFFSSIGVIPVNRTIKDKSVIPASISIIEKGGVLGIFPESTINKTDDLIMPFKIGAVKIAQLTKTLIIPIIINGKYKPFGNKLEIKFLKPIKIISSNLTKENEKLMETFKKELKFVKEK